jgi:hypothetical protein
LAAGQSVRQPPPFRRPRRAWTTSLAHRPRSVLTRVSAVPRRLVPARHTAECFAGDSEAVDRFQNLVMVALCRSDALAPALQHG